MWIAGPTWAPSGCRKDGKTARPRATQPLRLCLVLAAVSALGSSEYNRACCWRTTRGPVPCLVVLRLRGGVGRVEVAQEGERASARKAAKPTKQAKTRKRSLSLPRAAPVDAAAADGDDDEEKLRASLQGELAAVFGDMTALSPRLLLCCVAP